MGLKKNLKIETFSFRGLPIRLIRKPYQSSLRIHIKLNGEICLSASKKASLKEISNFLEKSQKWIQKTVQDILVLKKKHPLKSYTQNEKFLFLGEDYRLKFYPSLVPEVTVKVEVHSKEIKVLIPERLWNSTYLFEPKPEIRERLLGVYKNYGKNILSQSLDFYAHYMKLRYSKVSFRSQKTMWGSCSPRGHISLNWRLIVAPLSVINYVVIHELAHLKHMDHSIYFWNFLKQFCPNYKVQKNWLVKNQYEMDFLSLQSELH